jgi:Zn-dependent metalloprotease
VHLDSKDDIYLFNGRYNRSISGFDTVPTITAEQAVELAVNDLSSAAVTVRHDNIELVIYTQKDGRSVLTFQVTISSAIDYSWIYFINAKTGEVEHKYNDIQTAIVEASGTDLNGINRSFKAWHNPTDNLYYLIDPSTPTLAKNADPVIEGPQALGDTFVYDESTTPITIANNNTQDNWSDPIAVSAHYNTRLIYDYYKETYGRDSIDGKGQNLLIKISGKERLGNAFWHQGFIYYGEGNLFKSFAGCLDVAAHEVTHGIIEKTAGLIYANQSGALNESFADIMGAMIDKKDWTIGEDCAKSIPYLRSLKNPATELLPTHYRQPAHLKDYLNKENTKAGDYGGVHSNSGITNRAAYLISEGLTEEGLGQSIGRENTEQIYYRALTTYLTASATFVDARRGLIKSAEELFGSGSDDVTAIKIAFDAVGIVDTENFDSTPTPIETVDGDDIMAYLYTEEVNAENIDYQLFVQTFANPFTGYDPENDIGPYNDAAHGDLPAYYTKPAIVNVSSELKVFYIANDNNIYEAKLNAPDEQLTQGAKITSIAVSPNGDTLVFTANQDNKLYIFDQETDETIPYPVIPKNYQSEDVESNTILFADALNFDYSGNKIVFDALNCLSTPVSSCDVDDGGYRFWSIGIFNMRTKQFEFPITNQDRNFDYGFPSFASNNDFVITYDVIDNTNLESNNIRKAFVYTMNLETRDEQLVHQYPSDYQSSGIPSFWGDDKYLVLVGPSESGGNSTFRVALDANWKSDGELESLNEYMGDMPAITRSVTRTLTGDVSLSTSVLDFGRVNSGDEKVMDVVISNHGNNDIMIDNIKLSTEAFDNDGVNGLLPQGEQRIIKVSFEASEAGMFTDTLVIETSGTSGNVSVSLAATSLSDDEPPVPGNNNNVRFDQNGDGQADALWRNQRTGVNYLWAMAGMDFVKRKAIETVPTDWDVAGRGDFDGDGKSDILWRNNQTGENGLWLMDGFDVKDQDDLNTIADLNWQVKAIDDFNNDGKADVFWHHKITGKTYLWEMDGFTIINAAAGFTIPDTQWEVAGAGDINNDGNADIIWRHQGNGKNYVWLMDGISVESRYSFSTIPTSWDIVGLSDLNGDGTDDILWRNKNDGRNWGYLMKNGQVVTSKLINTIKDENWQIAMTGDFNGDGKADIFWHHQATEKNYIYLMNGLAIIDKGFSVTIGGDWKIIHH